MTKDKGRGVFAAKSLKRGELLVVERAVADTCNIRSLGSADTKCPNDSYSELVNRCSDLARLKGIEALRMSYLFDGAAAADLAIPPLEIYVQNYYKKYQIPDIPIARLKQMISLNTFRQYCAKHNGEIDLNSQNALFCFKSLINHNRNTNVAAEHIT